MSLGQRNDCYKHFYIGLKYFICLYFYFQIFQISILFHLLNFIIVLIMSTYGFQLLITHLNKVLNFNNQYPIIILMFYKKILNSINLNYYYYLSLSFFLKENPKKCHLCYQIMFYQNLFIIFINFHLYISDFCFNYFLNLIKVFMNLILRDYNFFQKSILNINLIN